MRRGDVQPFGLQATSGGLVAYESTVRFRWGEPPDGITLFVLIRGRPYQRTVGPGGWVSMHEAAVILNKDFSTVFRWVQARKIRAVRKGNVLMVPLSEVKRVRAVAGQLNWDLA